MPNLITINMRPSSTEKVFKGHQTCLLSDKQQCLIGDVFPLELNGTTRYFRVIDIWSAPKDFALKYLWRLCGMESSDQLNEQFESVEKSGVKANMVFAHIYAQISAFDEIQDLVNV